MSKGRIRLLLEVFIVAVAIIVFYKAFDSLSNIFGFFNMILSIMTPFIVGAILAYFLYPLCKVVEKQLEKTKNEKIIKRRLSIAVFITYFSFLIILIILLNYLIPIAITNVIDFANKSSVYYEEFEQLITTAFSDPKILSYVQEIMTRVQIPIEQLVNFDFAKYAQGAISTASTLLSGLMGIVICPYILFERRNLMRVYDKIMGIFINEKYINLSHVYARKIHVIFSNFIYGKAIDSIIIGIIAYIGFTLLGLKFAFVLALIILVTNMIPYFGPFIGGIPVVFITLIVMNPLSAIWTAIFILALQQFDGLILGPAILGDSIGISPFWIIFAITLFGGLFGFVGMFIGVPVIAVIRMILIDIIELKKNKAKI